jgi:hypothetical protein
MPVSLRFLEERYGPKTEASKTEKKTQNVQAGMDSEISLPLPHRT